MRSKVKVNFCTLSIRPCGLSPRNSVVGDIVTRPFVGGLVDELLGACVCVRHALPCGYDSNYSVCQSLSNFTSKLWMIRRGTLLILGHEIKGQGQLLHSFYKTLWTIPSQQRCRGYSNAAVLGWFGG